MLTGVKELCVAITMRTNKRKTNGLKGKKTMVRQLKGFNQIDPWHLNENAFQIIGKDFMELAMGNPDEGANAMTAAWGGFGVMWNLPVAFVVVRGEEYRFSRHIIDKEPLFSANFLGPDQAKAKTYLGKAHGWDDPQKIETAGLHTGWCGHDLTHDQEIGLGTHFHTPFIEESRLVLMCEKICEQELPHECFNDEALWQRWYTKEGQHKLYIAEIVGAFAKE